MISVIIPTLNEAHHLPETLSALAQLGEAVEIVVVDAGSEDGTADVAEKMGARVITSDRRQRAHQCNLGAAQASGDILWFLHADTWVSPSAVRSIDEALKNPRVAGGGFRRRFRSASPLLLVTCMLASLRGRLFGLYFGDQSLVARRVVFEAIGGFSDLPVFEDFDLCQRLQKEGKLACLGPPVRSSARRFEKRGALAVTLHDLWLTLRYQWVRRFGASGNGSH